MISYNYSKILKIFFMIIIAINFTGCAGYVGRYQMYQGQPLPRQAESLVFIEADVSLRDIISVDDNKRIYCPGNVENFSGIKTGYSFKPGQYTLKLMYFNQDYNKVVYSTRPEKISTSLEAGHVYKIEAGKQGSSTIFESPKLNWNPNMRDVTNNSTKDIMELMEKYNKTKPEICSP